ncbi:hypothetical protein D9599_19440 [Roseomonas sp. KE2513]|uniref:hypothetical protein n=1 Tax=Roseomonas sp. KE2513 TaxID=2479202 RepID=UPI0018E061FF|nr:hypothetical protein [Roseomonas sp. KE2513]MBI0537739.1 hypothetical protein [Roseomonas sp. KE2513]
MKDNPLIAFLASYGPSAASDSLADEHVQTAVARHGVRAIEAPAPKLDAMKEALLGDDPCSLILTGTAGDGKTYHIRRFFIDAASGDPKLWPGKEGVLATSLCGRPLRIIRDLSQLTDAAKAEEIEGVTRSLLGEDRQTLYLVAANDGQLLKFWRDACEKEQLGAPGRARYEVVLRALTDMLHRDSEVSEAGKLRVRLVNLSRTVTGETLDAVLDSILKHEAWDTGCTQCQQDSSSANPCPIRLNRALLMGSGPDGSDVFRHRLKQAIRIAALNDQHVPIRQILILAVNILLGDSKKRDRPMLTCGEARKRAKDLDYARTNPFGNAVGLNVRPERRRALTIFSALETFGVGSETNTALDNLLMDRMPAEAAERLEKRDPIYGEALFRQRLRHYRDGTEAVTGVNGFAVALEAQRRRLFFLMDEPAGAGQISPWRLTIYHHAGEYLAFAGALSGSPATDAKLVDTITGKLVKGINRTLTGMMVEETQRVWLARSIGRSDGASGRFTSLDPVPRKAATPQRLTAALDPATGRPRLQVVLRTPGQSDVASAPLELRPLLFEYLMRVADGSLPSSFSRQCQQEVRHFALAASSFIENHFARDETEYLPILILSAGRDGQIQSRDIGV